MPLTEEQRKLAEDNRWLALKYARPFRSRSYHDDIVSEAYRGVMHAATIFDPARDVKFSTVAYRWMRAYVGRFIHGGVPMIRVPEYLWHGVTDKRAKNRGCVGSAAQVMAAKWSRCDSEYDVAASLEPNPAEAAEHADQLRWLELALSGLPERDREILERRARGEKCKPIARTYGLTGERVRQIEIKALGKLREHAGIGGAA